jgi:hypothetical protein
MLLELVKPVQPLHRHQSGQHKIPDLSNEVADGAPNVRAVDVATRDCQKIFGFDTGDIASKWPPSSTRPRR